MKKYLMFALISLCLTSMAAYADNSQTTPSTNNGDSSIIQNISMHSKKLYITSKDKTKHVIKLSKTQWQKLKEQGGNKFDELQKILDQYHFQWPIAKDSDSSTGN